MTTFRLINEQVKANCIAHIEGLYGPYEVCIKKTKRSNAQNSYWHMLVGILASHTGHDPDELKLRIKYEALPLKEIEVRGVKHLYPISTTQLTKEQFSGLIEATLIIFHQLGLVAPVTGYFGMEP